MTRAATFCHVSRSHALLSVECRGQPALAKPRLVVAMKEHRIECTADALPPPLTPEKAHRSPTLLEPESTPRLSGGRGETSRP